MSELQFPKDPIVGQEYNYAPYKYRWDGVKWRTVGIGYNPVNNLRDEVLPTTREAIRRSYAEAGFNLVDGSFEEGGTLTSASDVLLHKATGIAYSGPIGSVAAGTNPVSGAFVDKSGELLRTNIIGTQITGWGNPTGVASRTGFDTSTVSVSQLAERVKALIDDMKAHGLLGS